MLQSLVELAAGGDVAVRRIGIRAIRELVGRERNLPVDLLTHSLYTLLEDTQKIIQVEALLALLALGDDYAIQVLEDFLAAQDQAAITEILANLDAGASHEVMTRVLSLVFSDKPAIHRELRLRLEPYTQGPFAELIRTTLTEALKGRHAGGRLSTSAIKKAAETEGESFLRHAKDKFKLQREQTQQLTVFFTDIVSYTQKASDVDSVILMKLLRIFEEEITVPTLERLKGTVVKKMGDGLLATFKHPLNAVIAALLIQQKIEEYNQLKTEAERFRVRVGLNTGPVICKAGDIYGDTVNVASRMETAASPGEVLLTPETYKDIKEHVQCTQMGAIQVKGKAEAITPYSAVRILIDVDQLLSGEGSAPAAGARRKGATGSLATLQESMFEPRFQASEGSGLPGGLVAHLESLFRDLTGLAEEVSDDYQQEYLFKQFLQERWDRMLSSLSGAPDSRGSVPGEERPR